MTIVRNISSLNQADVRLHRSKTAIFQCFPHEPHFHTTRNRQQNFALSYFSGKASVGPRLKNDCLRNRIISATTGDVDIFSPAWIEHYAETPWAALWDYVSPKGYAEVTALAEAGDEEAVLAYLYEKAPSNTNAFKGNVCVGVGTMFIGNGVEDTNMSAGTEIFYDYDAGDLRLTAEGLAEIQESIPGFREIPIEMIGLKPASSIFGISPVCLFSEF